MAKPFKKPRIVCVAGRKAVCYWRRKEKYLGTWNGDGIPEPPILELWLRLCGEWQKQHEAAQLGIDPPALGEAPTEQIDVAIDAYMTHLASPDGGKPAHFEAARAALRPLSALFGATPVGGFRAADLLEVQRVMIDHVRWWRGPDAEIPRPWSRETINRRVRCVLRAFEWFELRGMVAEGRSRHLALVPSLKKGRSSAHEPPRRNRIVDDATIEAVCRYVSPTVAAMIRLARITAMRPAEVVRLRVAAINTDGLWEYRPESHKLEHLEIPRTIYLGALERDILEPFLDRPPGCWLFDPAESRSWYFAQRTATRKTKVYPSEVRRVAAGREAAEGRRRRAGGRHYTPSGFRLAILYGIRRALSAGVKIARFSPYDLRHTRATEIEREHGARAAQAVLGHMGLKTTDVYLHELADRARQVVATQSTAKVKPS